MLDNGYRPNGETFSVQALEARLPELALRARFAAPPLEVALYDEDPRLLLDIPAAAGALRPVLAVVWRQAQQGTAAELLYRSQGWDGGPGHCTTESALLELQLMLRAIPDLIADETYSDYSVAGLVFLQGRLGQAVAEHATGLSLCVGGDQGWLQRLA
jgi:hypothetical protein